MYKIVLTHEILPGKLGELKAWCKQQNQKRLVQDPSYRPYKRYVTVFGNVHQVVIEVETDQPPQDWLSFAYAEVGPEEEEGSQGEFLKLIVPGRTELKLLKELDLS